MGYISMGYISMGYYFHGVYIPTLLSSRLQVEIEAEVKLLQPRLPGSPLLRVRPPPPPPLHVARLPPPSALPPCCGCA